MDQLVPNAAFKFNLRRYAKDQAATLGFVHGADAARRQPAGARLADTRYGGAGCQFQNPC
jgi:hypothetical protein